MTIRIDGASEHNLQDISVEIGGGLTVVTGVSGSGKTSLVFDTLYHEARRRFLEVFASGPVGLRLSPARVRNITGLGPAVAVGQNLLNRNPASTLATACGLHPLFRLLYARFGERFCADCGTGLWFFSKDEIVERLEEISHQGPASISARLFTAVRGSHATLLGLLARLFNPSSIMVDHTDWDGHSLDPAQPHTLEVELLRLEGALPASRLRQVLEQAAGLGSSAIVARHKGIEQSMAWAPVCTQCGAWFGDLDPVHFHTPCPFCNGQGCNHCHSTGLHPQAASILCLGLCLPELLALTVDQLAVSFDEASFPSVADRLRSEIERRLEALRKVGLGYVSLDRPSPSLSRGEAQRVRLAVAITNRLEDMLHVLDEPTIGLHPADVTHLLPALRSLAGPVVYVEHDRLAAAAADHAIDLGPGAGVDGGRVTYIGTPAGLWQSDTPTGRYFSFRQRVEIPEPRPAPEAFFIIRGAALHNLKRIDVPIPVSRLTVVTGVSGSGKSTLVEDVLFESLEKQRPAGCDGIDGPWLRPVMVDQSPIGRNPRSNPATYTNLADIIRDCFASATGLSSSHFSFNRPEGACPTCLGMGSIEVKMRYLPSTWIPCPDCEGQRFSDEILAAPADTIKGQINIADFFELSVAEALPVLQNHPCLEKSARLAAKRILEALSDVGLGYLRLGQPSTTLSGGEAQRVKLAKFLGRPSLTRHLLILDEPSTGLHPQDIHGLLVLLDHLVRAGATILIVEHNTDVIRSADWIIDLGPGAGPAGGSLIYAGPPADIVNVKGSLTGKALREEERLSVPPDPKEEASLCLPQKEKKTISIRGARAHNLKHVSVDFIKGALNVVTGVSGSGKSSLVHDVLEIEARRRFLETLSMYERQSTQEGPEAPVESISGLGVTLTVSPERRLHDQRATVGSTTEISHHLAVLLSAWGERTCLDCGTPMVRGEAWTCPQCHATAPLARPRHFSTFNYASACLECHGIGSHQAPCPEKLIIHPDKPLIAGAMYSPGFFPKGYLGKPFNGGYDLLQALGHRFHFDPAVTHWNRMSPEAQHAFLFGDQTPMPVTYYSRSGRTRSTTGVFPGFYGWIRDWDVGGTYTQTIPCPSCKGTRLRPEYLAVTLAGSNIYQLSQIPLAELFHHLEYLNNVEDHPAAASLCTIQRRLRFLQQVGLSYLHLNQPANTLSAGEAQRIRLAGMLGSNLTSMTVLLDEPTRGLHPSEVEALLDALKELCAEGNTAVVIEHDLLFMQTSDYLVDVGPGAGSAGGEIVACGTPAEVTAAQTTTGAWLRGDRQFNWNLPRRSLTGWMEVKGARANNLKGETVRVPLGVLVGVCGVSGSGKSTLLIDTVGRALAPKKQTTSVAYEPVQPGIHEAILGAPARVLLIDQARARVESPVAFLNLDQSLRTLYAATEDALGLGLDESQFTHACATCHGRGAIRVDMGFLPDLNVPCETCQGTGLKPEAWEVRFHGLTLPELYSLTIDQVYSIIGDEPSLNRTLEAARQVGLGYLIMRQPGFTLSGGEVQRLKIARELSQKPIGGTLYILDEPTVGQHLEDVNRLSGVLHDLVAADNSVIVIEHHPHLLAACDWLIELGPVGGPQGGYIIASGTPEALAAGVTPTAPYLRELLRVSL
jgi:excinuclease ABC subunit A